MYKHTKGEEACLFPPLLLNKIPSVLNARMSNVPTKWCYTGPAGNHHSKTIGVVTVKLRDSVLIIVSLNVSGNGLDERGSIIDGDHNA